MISDVLFETSEKVRNYLGDFEGAYGAPGTPSRTKYECLIEVLDILRRELDLPPVFPPVPIDDEHLVATIAFSIYREGYGVKVVVQRSEGRSSSD